MSIKNEEFVQAARSVGASKWRILFSHVLPNAAAPIISYATVALGTFIVAEATLSFLGIGLPPTIVSWGGDISQAQASLRQEPMVLFYPAGALALTVLSFIMMGDVVRDARSKGKEAIRMTDHNAEQPLLEMKDVKIAFTSSTGIVEAVRGVNMTIYPGQSVAIVGESGSGKSTTAMSILGLLPGNGKVTDGQIIFEGQDITGFSNKDYEKIRGSHIGLVPQDPMSNLNPVWRIGTQVEESLKANNVVEGSKRKERVVEVLEEAGLPDAERRAKQYPHEFSGGMRQRALIGIGLAARPKLLIADEPTSALDVTVQKQILDHLETLTKELGNAVLFITHDLGLAAERAEHLIVMHRGRIVESGPSRQILKSPQHPYTRRLVTAAPSLASSRIRAAREAGLSSSELIASGADKRSEEAVISVRNLTKEFDIRGSRGDKKHFKAVDNVSFDLRRGSTLALVGESGSGKSTVANMVLNLLDPTSGTIEYEGQDVSKLNSKQLFDLRRKMQVVFQNPYGSFDRCTRSLSASKNPCACTRLVTARHVRNASQNC